MVYVWIDALSNYITDLGYLTDHDEDYKVLASRCHLVGRILPIPHHYMAGMHGLGYSAAKEGLWPWLDPSPGGRCPSPRKCSGPVILADKYGVDAIRYYVLREMPFGSDGVYLGMP